MKLNTANISTLLLAFGLLSFSSIIGNCFISFNKAINLEMASPDRLPETSEKVRQVKTDKGDVNVSRIDGYRILYNNKKQVPFVNLKVELSEHASYAADTVNIIDNLKYLNSHSADMETKDLLVFDYNGYKIYGLSRKTIEKGSTLGTFAMFPGNDITVYFYFNNLKPEFRNFENIDEYKNQRNSFMLGYTSHLKKCLSK